MDQRRHPSGAWLCGTCTDEHVASYRITVQPMLGRDRRQRIYTTCSACLPKELYESL